MDQIQDVSKVSLDEDLSQKAEHMNEISRETSHMHSQAQYLLDCDSLGQSKKIENIIGQNSVPLLTYQKYISLFQDVISVHELENCMNRKIEHDGNIFVYEIGLFYKISQSLLPRRISNIILDRIKTFLKDNYDGNEILMVRMRLRNKGVIFGYILFSIYELKFLQEVVFEQMESYILNKKQNEIIDMSVCIAELIESQIQNNCEKVNGKIDEKQFINMSNCFLEYFLKFSCEEIRTIFIFSFVSASMKMSSSEGQSSKMHNIYPKLEQFCQQYKISKDKLLNQISFYKQQQNNRQQKFQEQQLVEKRQKIIQNIESNFNEQTSGEQSESIHSIQVISKDQYKINIIEQESESDSSEEQQIKQQKQFIIDLNQKVVQIVQQNVVIPEPEPEPQNVQLPNQQNQENVPELQMLGSTMDSLNPAPYEQLRDENVYHFSPVVQNLQQQIHQPHELNGFLIGCGENISQGKQENNDRIQHYAEIIEDHTQSLIKNDPIEKSDVRCQSVSVNISLKPLQVSQAELESKQ